MNRWLVFVGSGVALALCLATAHAQTTKPAARLPPRFSDPIELSGPPKATPSPPSAARRRFAESGVLKAFDPKKPETIAPTLRALNEFLKEDAHADFYLLRAVVGCYSNVPRDSLLSDIATALSARSENTELSAFKSKREMYALKAKVEFDSRQFQTAADDLENAIKEESYRNAEQTFNDGGVKPSVAAKPCEWTQADLDMLAQQLPKDYRPPLFLGLYLNFFKMFNSDGDFKPILDAFARSSALNSVSPLPSFYTGDLYIAGRIGGMLSTANAKCLHWVTPRTPECLELDKLHHTGLRWLTQAIALDPTFAPAYQARALGLWKVRQHRQAIRDYDKALELRPTGVGRHGLYNDRGLAKMELKDYEGAIADFTSAIALGCDELCFENRAVTYEKILQYSKAIADYTMVIRRTLSSYVFLINIDQFRRIYPEYDALADDAVAEKLRVLFFPEMVHPAFAKQFLIDAREMKSSVLPDLYLKRGDGYAKLGNVKKANAEYDRVSRGFPDWAKTAFTEIAGKRVRNRQ